jgi:hypothetical protein
MIFSRDKRPTEPGQYWAVYNPEDTPQIRNVYRQPLMPKLGPGYNGLLIVEGQGDIERSSFLWGDLIPLPTVEVRP